MAPAGDAGLPILNIAGLELLLIAHEYDRS